MLEVRDADTNNLQNVGVDIRSVCWSSSPVSPARARVR